MQTETMLALSWKQPYAQLMLPPFNKVETRTWKTNYRGLVLMCSSMSSYTYNAVVGISGFQQADRVFDHIKVMIKSLPTGMAIAVGRLVECRPMTREDENDCFVEYYPDRYCHIYKDVRPIKPFEWKGAQRWSKVSEEIQASLIYL
jgi:hypothetical protein